MVLWAIWMLSPLPTVTPPLLFESMVLKPMGNGTDPTPKAAPAILMPYPLSFEITLSVMPEGTPPGTRRTSLCNPSPLFWSAVPRTVTPMPLLCRSKVGPTVPSVEPTLMPGPLFPLTSTQG